ncbi:zinc finger protein 346-like [Asparagus officinalis]|nr:zinc finger protein 346-like [Asparagus officinalis]
MHAHKAFGIPLSASKLKVPAHVKALHSTIKPKVPNAARRPVSQGLITFVQSSYCDVCKVHCDTQEVLNSHKLGKKHMKNLQKLQQSLKPKPETQSLPTQPSYCDVCKVHCNTENVLSKHKLGRRHVKNLQKLQESLNPKPETDNNNNNTVNEPAKQDSASKVEEDLETKKQKVLSGGAAADAVRECTYCNVVCNSEVVYCFHVSGKKHIAAMKKHQEAQQQQQ